MKTLRPLAILCLSIPIASAIDTAPQPAPSPIPDQSAYSIVERGQSYNIFERTVLETGPGGRPVPKKHRYTALAAGLNYMDANGSWVPSQEQILPSLSGGAAATQGQHKVDFPYNFQGVIDQTTPDGLHLRSRPLCIAYACATNSELIAEFTTNSVGQILPAGNTVIYTNCTTDFACDVVAEYRRSGFSCSLIFRQKPPPPDALGFTPEQTTIQLWTEFFLDGPEPAQQPGPITSDGLQDTTLRFGATVMGRGSAFLAGNDRQPLPPWRAARVYKTWTHIGSRTFLIEQIPYARIANDLNALAAVEKPARWFAKSNTGQQWTGPVGQKPTDKGAKPRAAATLSPAGPKLMSQLATPRLPPSRPIAASAKPIQLAKVDLAARPGLAADFETFNMAATNFICRGDCTYFLSGPFTCESNLTLEGGTVIKASSNPTNYPYITVHGSLQCLGSPYRYSIFTSMDDRSAGEDISSSSGSPATMNNVTFLYCQAIGGATSHPWQLQYARISYALLGCVAFDDAPLSARHCQFVDCECAFGSEFNDVTAENCLVAGATWPIYAGGYVSAANLTVDGCTNFCISDDVPAGIALTNCIVVGTNSWVFSSDSNTNQPSPILDHTLVQANAAGLFQTVGAAFHYLSDQSTNRACGTTNISASLLADLRNKTTCPPIVYSNLTISAPTTFSPQAQRETAAPDIGFGYDPLDLVFGAVQASANLTFTPGTAIAWFEVPGSGGAGYGIGLGNGVTNIFNGTATSPCILARYNAVQEGGNGLWRDKGWLAGIASFNADDSQPPQVTATFTHMAELANDPNHFRDYSNPIIVRANHSEFWSGQDGGYGIQFYLTNCLIDRCPIGLACDCSPTISMRNCTMHGASLSTEHWATADWPVWIENSAFDGTTFDDMDDPSGGDTNITWCNFNAFLTNSARLPMQGARDVLVTNYQWQSSWYGPWYLPTNSPLINVGSVGADVIGLYHFTVMPNELKETNSVADLGYHTVAVDANGVPVSSSGDSLGDYLKDSNGDGIYNAGDLGNWRTNDTCGDGVNDYIKYLQGRNLNTNAVPDTTGIVGLQIYTPLR